MFLPIGRQALMPALPACRSAKTLDKASFGIRYPVSSIQYPASKNITFKEDCS